MLVCGTISCGKGGEIRNVEDVIKQQPLDLLKRPSVKRRVYNLRFHMDITETIHQ